jgi:kinesin family protein 3/17
MQLQEEKEQALQDKNEAIRELEKASRQYLIEREEKLKLEKKIQMMSEQMITGGHKIEETPQFQTALKNQLKLYENKILEIEKERQQLEEDKAENKEYKELLLKQRDIMNALTYKLNERDEYIAQLQEQLASTEKNEQGLRNRVNFLENILTEKKIPYKIYDFNYNNINVFKKNNYSNLNNFSSSYLPYEAETNSKQFEGRPIIMLSSKEKIKELRSIISEQENKIHFLDLVSQKFINTMNHDGKIDINKLLKQMENSKELYQKINKLQKENNNLKMEVNEQNNYINNILNCNKKEISKNSEIEELEEFKSGLITILDNSIKNTEGLPMQNELLKIYKYINNNKKDNNNIIINEKSKNDGENDDEKLNLIKKNSNIDISNNNVNNSNMNNNNINNFMNHKKSMSSVNTNKYNSIKGISFTPYIQKPNNQNNNQKDVNDNLKEINYNENNNNINKKNINLQYLTEKNRINIDQRLKNKKYINKFINSNV